MAIKSAGFTATFAGPGQTAIVNISEFSQFDEYLPFVRTEFMGDKLRNAKNTDGSSPVYFQLANGQIFQYFDTCGTASSARPLTPDDSRVDSIYQRFDQTKFIISGSENDQTQVDALSLIAKSHQVLLAEFSAHQDIAKGDVSYDFLLTMQSETFSYLVNTSTSMTGSGFGGFSGQSNLLITKFTSSLEYDDPLSNGTHDLLSVFRMECEVRSIVSYRSSSF